MLIGWRRFQRARPGAAGGGWPPGRAGEPGSCVRDVVRSAVSEGNMARTRDIMMFQYTWEIDLHVSGSLFVSTRAKLCPISVRPERTFSLLTRAKALTLSAKLLECRFLTAVFWNLRDASVKLSASF